MSNPVSPTDNSKVSQSEYMKLFVQELTYQDPLKPVDNREFMAQMAQFSALEATQEINSNLSSLIGMTNASLTVMMLGKKVSIEGSEGFGVVKRVMFTSNGPELKIHLNGGEVTANPGQITEIQG